MTKSSAYPLPLYIWILAIFPTFFFCSSCSSTKPIPYFKGTIDTNVVQKLDIPEQIVQPGDILSITIYSDNPEATAIFNQAGSTVPVSAPAANAAISKSISTQNAAPGTPTYLVDKEGFVFLHGIGKVNVRGLSLAQISDKIIAEIRKLGVLTNPYCVARFSNFKITVLGEVRSPGLYSVPGEKASLFEALGLAGDITEYGIKDRVLIIREEDGKRIFRTVDLLDQGSLLSTDYYLRQNDVIVVQSDGKKPTTRDMQRIQYITAGAAIASTIAIFITIFKQ